jgi:CHAT domain-containing protein
VPELVWQAQAGAANALRRTGQPDRARERFEAALAAIDQGRQRLFRTESKLGFLTEPMQVYQDYVALLLELGRQDDALAIVEASRARTLLETGGGSPRERPTVRALVRAAREHDVVLLSYWISPRGSFAWVFRGDGARRVPLGDAEPLGRLVRAQRRVIEEGLRNPLESGNEAARELYTRLVAPVRELLPENARVIVVPDGPLHALNLETLVVDGPQPHYLIEDVTIEIAPALAPLLAPSSPAIPGAPAMLIVGDPEPSDPAFPRLPHAAEEIQAIAARVPSARIDRLTGRAATPPAVLSAPLERYAWLHFAAHAQTSLGNPLDASIVLSGEAAGGKLYARDLVGRRLGARLVTLSACRSAGERAFSGEGMVGLAWVFMKAGAAQVIAGLWDVSDRSTVVLMEGVYDRLGRGVSPCDALRQAKLDLMRASPATSKPFHWAPFQIYTRTAAREVDGATRR